FCMLLGRTEVVPEEQLRRRWADREEYLRAYTEATDRLIDEGFLMADDRDEILADARPERIIW
ncbi:alpha/beta hydrolase domain-containing protein, partial [Dietzia lutea]|uniref:alpha/beta hydrolase domain-containing protein n=1 Tax=Dietzia lutea TaxID=546160 RepID=UPI002285B2F6